MEGWKGFKAKGQTFFEFEVRESVIFFILTCEVNGIKNKSFNGTRPDEVPVKLSAIFADYFDCGFIITRNGNIFAALFTASKLAHVHFK